MNSRILPGRLLHARRLERHIRYSYPLPMLWLDLDELPALDKSTRWFGYNRRRVFAVHDRDYLQADDRPIREKIAALLKERDVPWTGGRIMLLTTARYFNYTFNPASFYVGFGPDDQPVFFLVEVNNTFSEKHIYLLDQRHRLPDTPDFRYRRDKDFYVSPFMDLAGHYDFRFRFPENGLDFTVNLIKQEKPAFHARLTGQFRPATATSFRSLCLRYPLTGWLTMTRILVQAMKLVRRGIRFNDRPTPVSTDTIGRRAQASVPSYPARLVTGALQGIHKGRLVLTSPDGGTREFGDPAAAQPVAMQVHDWRAFRAILLDGDIGLGDAYMNGDWTTDDLTGLIRLFLDNRESILAMAQGRRARRWAYRILGFLRRNSPAGSRRNIAAHYDLSNELFETFLDPSMTYSSAYFESPDQPLEEAQQAKYRRLCRKVDLKDGDHLLEIGCGWGGFALFAAGYAHCSVTAVTVSAAQYRYARDRVQAAGLTDRIDVRLQDYRTLEGRFDKIVSIEMFEAVGYAYYPDYFRAIERLLKPGGLFAMQVISMPDHLFHGYRKSFDWIRKHIFPGGLLPSLESITRTTARVSKLVVQDLENIGAHYAETLHVWHDNFNQRIDQVRGLGFDARFERMWSFYLCYCEAAFASRYLGNLQLVFARPLEAPPPGRTSPAA